jgi:hypothetical protein
MKSLDKASKGVTNLGSFWIIKKLCDKLSESERIKPPTRIEVERSLYTIYRYKMNAKV